MDFWNGLPYWVTGSIVRAARVFVYGAIPALAAFVLTNQVADFEIAIRTAASAAILALIDKGQREIRTQRASVDDETDPVVEG